ncbi:glycosyltransferase family 4 protein [Modestobacter sp. SYSU DS0290]
MTTRVAVDLVYLTGRKGGTETYGRELYRQLAEVAPDLRFHGLVNRESGRRAPEWFPGSVTRVPVSGEQRAWWAAGEAALVGPVARARGADVLHCPANFGPVVRLLPTVVTVHDLLSYRHPEIAGPLARGVSLLSGRAARAATRVLTDSRASAADIEQFLGLPAARVDVVPLAAAAPPVLPSGERRAPGARRTVLTTGNRLPHKNHEGLLRAWAAIPAQERPLLVVTGGPRSGADPLQPLVDQLGLTGDVELRGWLSTEELEELYRQADLYVCPSRFEGFGLPLLEAMQRRCAVVASDIPVLREVGGDAVRYVDTTSATDLAGAVRALLADPGERERLVTAGARRAAEFTWRRTAEATAESFRRAAHEGARRR